MKFRPRNCLELFATWNCFAQLPAIRLRCKTVQELPPENRRFTKVHVKVGRGMQEEGGHDEGTVQRMMM